MTKEELIRHFEQHNWELHEIYKQKLMVLSYGDLLDKLIHLRSQQAVMVFGGRIGTKKNV